MRKRPKGPQTMYQQKPKVRLDKELMISSALCFIPSIIAVILFNQLPLEIPSHFDFNGKADAYLPKTMICFGIPLFFAIMNILAITIINNDPKKTNYSKTVRKILIYILPMLSTLVVVSSMLVALGHEINITVIVVFLIGGLIFAFGNFLPKNRQNYTIGIKLPWTLNSEENWNKTHRLAGKIWMVGGILMMISSFAGNGAIVLIIIAIIGIIPAIYSFLLYKKGI